MVALPTMDTRAIRNTAQRTVLPGAGEVKGNNPFAGTRNARPPRPGTLHATRSTLGSSVSLTVVVALVLLPAAMYGLALALAATRTWLGITGIPRARNVVRAARLGRANRHSERHGERLGESEHRSDPEGPGRGAV
jgi:hypothetical protein